MLDIDLALIDSILEFTIHNNLRIKSGFKKKAWLITLKKIKKVLNSSQKITIKEIISKLQQFKTK